MARDENDRSYEDGQGRSLNPELTGDVLSPRRSTDEQPATQETYILPPVKGETLGGEVDAPAYVGDEVTRGYLPLDKAYEASPDETRAFLGSGWTAAEEEDDRGREVRRRTKVLLVGAAAVVVFGAGAGWMLTGASSEDPCAGTRCAGAGEVSGPAGSPAPDEASSGPEESRTPEPTVSKTARPTPTATRARPTRTATPRVTRTGSVGEPTVQPSRQATQESEDLDLTEEPKDAEEPKGADEQADRPVSEVETTEAVPEPVPTPTERRRGLFERLFPRG